MKNTIRIMWSLFLAIVIAGCQSHEGSQLDGEDRPSLIVASNLIHPPFSSRDENGQPVGIEVDLIEAAARSLGLEAHWVPSKFAELIPKVANGDADIAASTIGITEERMRLVAFTDSYFSTTIVALARPGVDEPKQLSQLQGRRVATERGTTAVEALKNCVPRAIAVLDKIEGKTWAEMLSAKQIDAIVLDHSHVAKFVADASIDLVVMDESLREEHFAFAVHKDARELRDHLNQAIAVRKAKEMLKN